MGRIFPESGNGLQRSEENAPSCAQDELGVEDRSILGGVKRNLNKIKTKKIW